jgi:hypothetical protein
MPNWCRNRLAVTGDSTAFAEFRRTAEGPGDDGKVPFDFERFVPAPEGLSDWYEWRIEHWGTKWNSHRLEVQADEPGRFVLFFETAWAPPWPVVRAASEAFPTLVFELIFNESEAPFAGRNVFQRGELDREEFVADDYGQCIALLEQVGWREEAERYREQLRAMEGEEFV